MSAFFKSPSQYKDDKSLKRKSLYISNRKCIIFKNELHNAHILFYQHIVKTQ